ncbi:hypothetical protein TeGR_g14637 [Tetraparma gracilis]|uniref:Fe2OG dioxygenase domain-containing protein n=1 Tax=Tetraparma gracilis TaxID=2962635 RepID=A0ABQ6MPN2_9STRA|nr:hypothetical protein TeGR_g14637 [Tetraparma gracilis]
MIRPLLPLLSLFLLCSAWVQSPPPPSDEPPNPSASMKLLWATPVVEYDNLFLPSELSDIKAAVLSLHAAFLAQHAGDRPKEKAGRSKLAHTDADRDQVNEEFFEYQRSHPLSDAVLHRVWSRFMHACERFASELSIPLEVQKPFYGPQWCWASVQANTTFHDVHTHPMSAFAGTLYLAVPADAGALSLADPRGPMPPFQYGYRVPPREGTLTLFPATVPHSVLPTPGGEPRVSISCNYPGNWKHYVANSAVLEERGWEEEGGRAFENYGYAQNEKGEMVRMEL